ncbi:MAG TPA: RNA polymerase sigma-70 factor [Chloroflexota bacterium]|nr:RNA polymerase sigma-70 factor [Chloroflexota bacterium]
MADDEAGAVFEQLRGYLFSIAYRLLGSVSDGEDAVQDAYLRWAVADESEIRSPRAFLATVVVRLCMDRPRSARARHETYIGPWLPEPLATSARPDLTETVVLRESLSLAFLHLLEDLAPVERAVFVLREVFDYDYTDIAAIVGKTAANCRQVFHRARRRLDEHQARFRTSPEQRQQVTEEFMQATSSGDVQRLLNVLAEDVVLVGDGGGKVPAASPRPVRSRDAVANGIIANLAKFPPERVWVEEVNGGPAIVVKQGGRLSAVLELNVRDGVITSMYAVANPDKLQRIARQLGLPA